jgi:GTP-binding protein
MADIPGIIEGASEGKGLGFRFLRHIERNSVLLFLVPADSKNIKKDYETLLNELIRYNPELADKQKILAVSKSDMADDELEQALAEDLPESIPFIFISSFTQKGIPALKDLLWKTLNEQPFHDLENMVHKPMDIRLEDLEDDFDYETEADEDVGEANIHR